MKHDLASVRVDETCDQRTPTFADPTAPDYLNSRSNNGAMQIPLIMRHQDLLPHQNAGRALLAPGSGYSGILIVHGLGTGKTRTALSISEQYVGLMLNPTLVLSSKAVASGFRSELGLRDSAKFSDGRWSPSTESDVRRGVRDRMWRVAQTVKSSKLSDLHKTISSAIYDAYEFSGYTAFANVFQGAASGRTTRLYSNRVIIVDEAHNLRKNGATKGVYDALMRIVRTCLNVKLVLMTATPMYDKASEILDLVNLLRANDGRELVAESQVFRPTNAGSLRENGGLTLDEEALRLAVRGYISRFDDPAGSDFPVVFDAETAKIPGVSLEWPEFDEYGKSIDTSGFATTIQLSATSSQEKAFAEFSNDAWSDSVEAANIIYPDGRIGKTGFESVFDVDARSYVSGLDGFFGETLSEASPKLSAIAESIHDATGIVLAYSRYMYSGTYPLAIALEERGFRPLDRSSAFTRPAMTRTTGPVYVCIDGRSDSSALVAKCKHKNNAGGEIVKVILATKVLSEGVDLANVRELHIVEGWWNQSAEDQLIGRVRRRKSHSALPAPSRNVTVLRYAVVCAGNKGGPDHETARTARSKRELIDASMKVIDDESVDCEVVKYNAMREIAEQSSDSQGDKVWEKHTTSRGVEIEVRGRRSNSPDSSNLQGLCHGRTVPVDSLDINTLPPQDLDTLLRDAATSISATMHSKPATATQTLNMNVAHRALGIPDKIARSVVRALASNGATAHDGSTIKGFGSSSLVRVPPGKISARTANASIVSEI